MIKISAISNWNLISKLNIIISKSIELIIYIILAIVIYKIIKTTLKKIKNNKVSKKYLKKNKNVEVIYAILINIIKYTIYFITILIILKRVFKINPALIVTATGLLGLAVGLGIQDLLKDFISGLFILFENKFNINDYVIINNLKGKIISLSIKNVTIQDNNGMIHIIPNRMVNSISRILNKIENIKIILYTNSNDKSLKKILKNLEEYLFKKYKPIIKDFSFSIENKKIGNIKIFNLKIKIKPFNDFVIEEIKEILGRNISDLKLIIIKE